MFKGLKKICALGAVKRTYLLRAVTLLLFYRLTMMLVPFRHLSARFAPLFRRPNPAGPPARQDEQAVIIWAVEAASRHLHINHCLTKALVARKLLLSAGCPGDLKIGINRDRRGRLQAHAWLVDGRRVLLGNQPALKLYKIMISGGEQQP